MKNNLKGVGMLVGTGILICGLLSVFLMVAQPSLLLQAEEWTLINVFDDDDNGIWMNENGDVKIDSVESYEVGETYESEVEIDFSYVILGVVFIMIGLAFIVGYSRIE